MKRHGLTRYQVERPVQTHRAHVGYHLDGYALRASEVAALRKMGYRAQFYLHTGAQAITEEGLHTEEVGVSGVRWSHGLPTNGDKNPAYRPAVARGRGWDHGLYHEMFLSSTTYRRSWSNIAEALVTGTWKVRPADGPKFSKADKRRAEELAETCEAALLHHLEGGWAQFLREWLYLLVAGCCIFEKVYHGLGGTGVPGTIRKLAFRYPSQVEAWVLDEHERDLLGVLFRTDTRVYALPASALLIDSWDRFGTNFEGISPLRSVARWIEMVNLLIQLQGLAAEKYGVPWLAASRKSNPASGTVAGSDALRDALQEVLDDALAEDAPVIALPDDTEVKLLVGPGTMPDFTPVIRLCNERISEILRAEGSLIGLGSAGAYAARESASHDLMRFAPYFGRLLCDLINGANNTPYTGVIKEMVDALGGPVKGRYPELTFSVGQTTNTARVDKINQSVMAGTLRAAPEVENEVRLELQLPGLTPEQVAAYTVTPLAQGESDDPTP